MNRFKLTLLSIFLPFLGMAQPNFVLDYALFNNPEAGNYIEFYLSVNGNSILYAEKDTNQYQAQLEVTFYVEKGDSVLSFKKYQLNSPLYKETDFKADLIDAKRMVLPSENLSYRIKVKDVIAKKDAEYSDQIRELKTYTDKLSLSEIQLASNLTEKTRENDFVKNGFEITPSVSHVFNDLKKELVVYFEIYNSDKSVGDTEYLIDVQLADVTSGLPAANLRTVRRLKGKKIEPILQSFIIDELPSGNYSVNVKAINRKNEEMAKQSSSFYRINTNIDAQKNLQIEGSFVDSIRNIDLLSEYIRSLSPISTNTEIQWAQNQFKYADLELMQRFFLNFWLDRNLANPQFEWLAYKKRVDFVHEKFGYGGVNGYNTERGRVFLKYGTPNTVQDIPFDGETYPHSIWQYNKLNGYTNQRFVFFTNTNGMLGYEIIHSTLPGEPKNENWHNSLSSKFVVPDNDRDANSVHPNSLDIFNNPR